MLIIAITIVFTFSFCMDKSKMQPEDIYGGQYSVVAYEAGNYLHGSVSWQIYHSDENPVKKFKQRTTYGRRLNVAYYLPWR